MAKAMGSSTKIVLLPGGLVPPPAKGIGCPEVELPWRPVIGQTSLTLVGCVPGALIKIQWQKPGNMEKVKFAEFYALSPREDIYLGKLAEGKITITQSFDGWPNARSLFTATVGAWKVPTPRIVGPIADNSTMIAIDALVIGGRVEIYLDDNLLANGSASSSGRCTFDLLSPLAAGSALTAKQIVGISASELSPLVRVQLAPQMPATILMPKFGTAVKEGAPAVRITNVEPGSIIRIKSQKYKGVVAEDLVHATVADIKFMLLPIQGDLLTLEQSVYGATKESKKTEVKAPTSSLNKPVVDANRLGFAHVMIKADIGSIVDLFQDGILVASEPVTTSPMKLSLVLKLNHGSTLTCRSRTTKFVSSMSVPVKYMLPDGCWQYIGGVTEAGDLAVHAAMMKSGKIVYYWSDPWFFDTYTRTVMRGPPVPPDPNPKAIPKNLNLFCSGHAMLHDGRLLIAGGTVLFPSSTAKPDKSTQDMIDAVVPDLVETLKAQGDPNPAAFISDAVSKLLGILEVLALNGVTNFDKKVLVKDFLEDYLKHRHHFYGSTTSLIFDSSKETWAFAGAMNHQLGAPKANAQFTGGRWYPTLFSLVDGAVVAISGHPNVLDTRHNNNSLERFLPSLSAWNIIGGADSMAVNSLSTSFQYCRMIMLPEGRAFCASPDAYVKIKSGGWKKIGPRKWEVKALNVPGAQDAWTPWEGYPYPDPAAFTGDFVGSFHEYKSAEILLPLLPSSSDTKQYRQRVLYWGAKHGLLFDLGPSAGGDFKDEKIPTWLSVTRDLKVIVPAGPKTNPSRRWLHSCILPTGEVFLGGGVVGFQSKPDEVEVFLDANGIKVPEMYTEPAGLYDGSQVNVDAQFTPPKAGKVRVLPAANEPRGYHCNNMLMPDGAVWVAGTSKDGEGGGVWNLTMEVYEPWYFGVDRPQIASGPAGDVIVCGADFKVEMVDATNVEGFMLCRCGSFTHSFNSDTRAIKIGLKSKTNGTVTALCPNKYVVLPGLYLLFALESLPAGAQAPPASVPSQVAVPSVGVFVMVKAN